MAETREQALASWRKRREEEKRVAREMALRGELAWYTTEEAALYLRTTPTAIRCRISRGTLKPDTFGGHGRGKQHLFAKATLDAHGGRAA